MKDGAKIYFLSSTGAIVVGAVAIMSLCGGCLPLFPFGECLPPDNPDGELRLRGNVWSSETQQPLMGANVDASLFTGTEETTRSHQLILDSQNPIAPLTGEDGAFGVRLVAKGPSCVTPPDLPPPDSLKIVVELDGCTREFSLDLTEDTVVDPTFPDRVIELKEPILVTACEE